MANANVTFSGANNGVETTEANQRALYLKVFSNEVLTFFDHMTVTLDKHMIRNLTGAKEAQFPLVGNMPAAEYHTPGAEILGQDVSKSERVIAVDRKLISHVFMDELDEKMKHFETRSVYSRKMAQRLAEKFDENVMRTMISAAAATSPITGGPTGEVYEDTALASTTATTKLDAWVDALYAVKQHFMDEGVPDSEVIYCAISNQDWLDLSKTQFTNGMSLINKDIGGIGSIAQGNVGPVAGIQLIPTAMLPTTNNTGDSYHVVDARNTKFIAWNPGAVGTVKTLDLSTRATYDGRRLGELLVAYYAIGHGILQGELAVHGRTATPA